MTKNFEQIGYFLEYYVDNKYIGSLNINKPDRDKIGYNGKIKSIATEDIKLKKRKIKKGQEYLTLLYPLNGRVEN